MAEGTRGHGKSCHPEWEDLARELLIQFQPTNIVKAHSGPSPALGLKWTHVAQPSP